MFYLTNLRFFSRSFSFSFYLLKKCIPEKIDYPLDVYEILQTAPRKKQKLAKKIKFLANFLKEKERKVIRFLKDIERYIC